MQDEYLSREETAKMLGIKASTLSVWGTKNSGKNLPHFRIGQKVFYKKTDILLYVESCKRSGGNPIRKPYLYFAIGKNKQVKVGITSNFNRRLAPLRHRIKSAKMSAVFKFQEDKDARKFERLIIEKFKPLCVSGAEYFNGEIEEFLTFVQEKIIISGVIYERVL